MSDRIRIHNLEIQAHLGVPEEERTHPQRLLLSLDLHLNLQEAGQSDDLSLSVNYFTVTQRVKNFVSARPRKLLECMAEDIAADLLGTFPIKKIEIEIKKFILTDAEYVSVRIERSHP